MGANALISSLFHALAWPAVALIALLVLKDKIGSLVSKTGPLKRLKAGAGGVELEYFDDTVAEARRELSPAAEVHESPEAQPGDRAVTNALDDFLSEMKRLAEASPRAVVLESFTRLEALMRRELTPLLDSSSARASRSVRTLSFEAVKREIISPAELGAFDDVRTLRNLVAHDPQESVDDKRAIEYAELVREIAIAILFGVGKTVYDDLEF